MSAAEAITLLTGTEVAGSVSATYIRETTSGSFNVPSVRVHSVDRATNKSESDVEDAVFAHIQAIRSLGETKTNSARIASALKLNRKLVERAIYSLQSKGVRVING